MSILCLDTLAKLYPFNEFSTPQLEQLLAKGEVIECQQGCAILRKHKTSQHSHYLIDGLVEVRSSFFERYQLLPAEARARQPLEDLAGQEAQVTALEYCRLVRFLTSDIVAASLLVPPPDYEVDAERGDALDGAYVVEDSSLHADWMSAFLHSPLVNHVSARDIQQLLTSIEDVTFVAGQRVVSAGEYGDYFYIVKSGLAVVQTDPNGPYRGREFSLLPGSYFGEEALVGNTIRNAEVYMESKGVLGRIDQEAFNTFIRDSLVVRARAENVNFVLESPGDHSVILDVRLYPEYRTSHRKNSTNVPLAALRERLEQMDIGKHYYITPEGGPRSELATFLMRQAGFNAVLIQEGGEPA